MSNRIFYSIIAILIIGSVGLIAAQKRSAPPETPQPGIEQPDLGNKHITAQLPNTAPEPPASGDMTDPVPCGQASEQEIPDTGVIHTMEHGGVYISYRPDLPADQHDKLKALFTKPFSNSKFTPSKAVLAPRAANSSPIILTSWKRNLKLDSFDEAKIMDYYLRNVSKAPEGTGVC